MNYRLDGAEAEKSRSQTIFETFREQFLFVGSDVHKYHQCLHLHTERLSADVTDGLSSILCNLCTEIKKLMKKQRKYIVTIVKIDFEAIVTFLRRVDSQVSPLGPSS